MWGKGNVFQFYTIVWSKIFTAWWLMGSPSNNFPLLIGNNFPGFEEGRMRLILHCHLQPWSKCLALNIHSPQFFPLPRSNASTFILCPVFCPACSSCWQFFDADQAFCKRPLRLMWALHCGHNYYFLTLTCNSLKLISLKYICWQLNVVGLKKRRQGTIASSLEGWGGGRGSLPTLLHQLIVVNMTQ